MPETKLVVNGEERSVDVDPGTPLLWVLREQLKMTGTKFGCGIAQCGACTVHVDGQPVRSCSTPLAAVDGAEDAPRLRTFTELFTHGFLGDVCAPSYGPIFSEAIDVVEAACEDFAPVP